MKSLSPFETDAEDDILCLEPLENNCDYQKGLIPDENEPPSLLLQGLISCMAATVEGNPDKCLVTFLFPHPGPACELALSNFSITLETGIDRFSFFFFFQPCRWWTLFHNSQSTGSGSLPPEAPRVWFLRAREQRVSTSRNQLSYLGLMLFGDSTHSDHVCWAL